MRSGFKIFFIILGHFPISIMAQVLVKDEPRHKTVLENTMVRVLDVRIVPGDTTLFHIHQTPSFFIRLSGASIGTQVFHGIPEEVKGEVGKADYDEFDKPLIHRVWNKDTSVFHVMDIEIVSKDNTVIPKIITGSTLTLLKDERRVRIYRYQLEASDGLKIAQLESPILIYPTKGAIELNSKNKIDVGQFQYREKGNTVTIKNGNRAKVTGVIFQIK